MQEVSNLEISGNYLYSIGIDGFIIGQVMEEPTIVDASRINTTIQKLNDPLKMQEAIDDLKKMIEIKQILLWRADAGTCCGSLCNIISSLSSEISFMEKTLLAINRGDKIDAIRILEEYRQSLSSSIEAGK